MECLDLLQLSMWNFDAGRFQAAADHAARLMDSGRIARLGVMNVDADCVAALRRAGARVASAQAQFSLIDRRAERELLPLCQREGLAFFGYGALAGGFISNRWLGRPDPGIAGARHPEYRVMIDAFGGWALFQRLLSALAGIAARHDVDIGTIALRWALDRPGVTT
jgi:aryl-alcohol dehydrogenase-like predicted oxidoreductase